MGLSHSELPAVVLDSRDHGESDKIVTLFCQDIGKLTAIAKGAHRSKKRFVNKLELFSFIQVTCSQSTASSLAVINEAELVNSFISIRSDLSAYQAASVIREFVLLATSERLSDDDLLKLILWSLNNLDGQGNPENTVALFLVKLFDAIGYRPHFSGCQNCGVVYKNSGPATFSIQAGGLLCSRCLSAGEFSGRQLSSGTIRTCSTIQKQTIEKLARVRLSGSVLREVLDLMYRYGRYLFQRDINSWKGFIQLTEPHK